MTMPLCLATFNFEHGGWDQGNDSYARLDLLPEVVAQIPDVDILFLQEARGWDNNGSTLLYRAEELLAPCGLRGFLTSSSRGPLHQVIFMRWPRLRPIQHYAAAQPGVVFTDDVGFLHARLDGLDRPLRLKSVHWPRANGDARLAEALDLVPHANPELATIIAGDFNSLWPGEQEFEPDWLARPPYQRTDKTLPPGARGDDELIADRRALTVLHEAGYVNVGSLAEDYAVTTHRRPGQGTRIDHILLGPRLGRFVLPATYRVWTGRLAEQASDHRLVSVVLDLGSSAGHGTGTRR